MRNTPNLKAEQFRVGGQRSDGNNGEFIVRRVWPHADLAVVVSDGAFWDHVSVHPMVNPPRTLTWEEMCFIKELFFKDDECVMQLHPPKADNISYHDTTLHLWRPQTILEAEAVAREWANAGEKFVAINPDQVPWQIPRPPSWMVAPKEGETKESILASLQPLLK